MITKKLRLSCNVKAVVATKTLADHSQGKEEVHDLDGGQEKTNQEE